MDESTAAAAPERTSAKAVWSLVLGILSNFCLWILGSIPAIILGILAMKEVDASGGRVKGRGVALAGIITGSIGILLGGAVFVTGIAILSSVAMPVTEQVQERAYRAKQVSDLRQIALGCIQYSAVNENRFPESLEELVPDFLFDPEVIEWKESSSSSEEPVPYLYRSDPNALAQPNSPFLASPVVIDGTISIAFPDGRVESIPEEEFEREYRSLFP